MVTCTEELFVATAPSLVRWKKNPATPGLSGFSAGKTWGLGVTVAPFTAGSGLAAKAEKATLLTQKRQSQILLNVSS